jgi:hypothetical protein
MFTVGCWVVLTLLFFLLRIMEALPVLFNMASAAIGLAPAISW